MIENTFFQIPRSLAGFLTAAYIYPLTLMALAPVIVYYFLVIRPKKGTLEWVDMSKNGPVRICGSLSLSASDFIYALAVAFAAAALKLFSEPLFSGGADCISGLFSVLASEFPLGDTGFSLPAVFGLLSYGGIAAAVYLFCRIFTGDRPPAFFASALYLIISAGSHCLPGGDEYGPASFFAAFTYVLPLLLIYIAASVPYEAKMSERFIPFLLGFAVLGYNQFITGGSISALFIIPALFLHIWDISRFFLENRRNSGFFIYSVALFLCASLCFILPALAKDAVNGRGLAENSVFGGILNISPLSPESGERLYSLAVILSLFGMIIGGRGLFTGRAPAGGFLLYGALLPFISHFLYFGRSGCEVHILAAIGAVSAGEMMSKIFSRGILPAKIIFILLMLIFGAGHVILSV